MQAMVIAQVDFIVGAIEQNAQKIIEAAEKARSEQAADLVIFPELALTGYPPEDLLLRKSMRVRVESALANIAQGVKGVDVILGCPMYSEGKCYNAAGLLQEGEWVDWAYKCKLPNIQVFDEKRYFQRAEVPTVFEWRGKSLGICICEDLWHSEVVQFFSDKPLDLLLSINASPYHLSKDKERIRLVSKIAKHLSVPVVYANLVGGQDELVFDGGSFVCNGSGELKVSLPRFAPSIAKFILENQDIKGPLEPEMTEEQEVYQALVLGVQSYVNKNRFPGVVLGLSGGIDSALTLAIAVDALGADRVQAVMMPFTYTAQISQDDAAEQAEAMGVDYSVISIEPIYESFMAQLSEQFANVQPDTTEENLQSRCRGVLLMAISNKTGKMVLTTGNKSEMAVGYATLYGDMAGGYGALKDVFKTMVFRLARYRNSLSPVIPERVITRPPSAELAPDQKDTDSLPDYDVLDAILHAYIEQDKSAEEIVALGFNKPDVYQVCRLVDINEYKRRQAPVGTRITPRGFGRDRRYPMTNGWTLGV